MLNIFSHAFTATTREASTLAPLGNKEARKLYLEQSRRARRAAQATATKS